MENQEKQAANPLEAGEQNAAIEAYLNRLCNKLNTLSPSRREEIRREVRAHLQLLVAQQNNAPNAVENALTQFGEPEKVGRNMARAARWNDVRSTWRAMRWSKRFGFLFLAFVGFWGAAMTVEFCRWMNWGGNFSQHFLLGAFLPLAIGYWWGTRFQPTRRGYLFIALTALALSCAFRVPLHLSHADLDKAGSMDLSSCVRFTFVLLWLWSACSVCALARMLGLQGPLDAKIAAK